MKKFNPTWIIVLAVAAIAIVIFVKPKAAEPIASNPSLTLSLGSVALQYLRIESYYVITNPQLVAEIDVIHQQAATPEQAVQMVLDYVYATLPYNIDEGDEACFAGTPQTIMQAGTAQCDTMSIIVIAMLRNLGIAARPVGGCLAETGICRATQALLGLNAPQYFEMSMIPKEELQKQKTFSRRGGLHAWVEAYMPSKGWITLEPTSGRIVDGTCYKYTTEMYPLQKNDICVSYNFEFTDWCAAQ